MKAASTATTAATASRAALLPRHIGKPGSPMRTITSAAGRQKGKSSQARFWLLVPAIAVLLLSVPAATAEAAAADAAGGACEASVQHDKDAGRTAASGGQQQGGLLQRSSPDGLSPYADLGQVAPTFGRVGGFLRSIEEEMNNMLQAVATGNLDQAPPEFRDVLVPLHVDIVDQKDKIIIKADVPGLSNADVSVVFDPDTKVMTISGEREVDRPAGDEAGGLVRLERKFGRFERHFKLPDDVDAGSITAQVKNGELVIEVPHTQPKEDKTQKIDVQ